MANVAVWLAGVAPVELIASVRLPEKVAPAISVAVAWESWVLTAKLVRPNEPPGDTGLGVIDPVTVTGRVVGPVTRVHVEVELRSVGAGDPS